MTRDTHGERTDRSGHRGEWLILRIELPVAVFRDRIGARDTDYVFGREALTAGIQERDRTHSDRIRMLLSNSDVGKSSIALAHENALRRAELHRVQ